MEAIFQRKKSHIGTSQVICSANQLTGFYMMVSLVDNGLKLHIEVLTVMLFEGNWTSIFIQEK